MRRLKRCTERMPFQPQFHALFIGTRQNIPAAYITNYLPPENDVMPGNGTQPDGSYDDVLKAVTGTPVRIVRRSLIW